jgi:hypothetical protein
MTSDEAELKILSLANDKRKFAISVGYMWSAEEQAAFERGIDHEWWTLVDLSRVATPAAMGAVMRIFRLTDAGLARLAVLRREI